MIVNIHLVEFKQKFNSIQTESTQQIDELTIKLQESQQELIDEVDRLTLNMYLMIRLNYV